ncbi:MAG TPA: ATP-binding protein [Candidatus Kapabacteria bacterium]|nr:ATP-binding protein [Candidatus Kapabacteria bacterium]
MKEISELFRQDVAFIDRNKELADLMSFIDKRSSEILFLHGPKSSGKTTLLYKFLDQVKKEQKLDIKFLNLREKLIANYKDFIHIFFGIDYSKSKDEVKEKREYSLFNFFKLSVEVLKGMESGELDPFEIMKREFLKISGNGVKPIIIIDELQALDKIYLNNDIERQLITALFNFFVAMTKESHLAHIIIASSDGYFLNTVYNDSRLKKCSEFYKVDYLKKEDVLEWLLNLEEYSKIKDYSLTKADAEKIWDTVGGSMWEIQNILSQLFEHPIDEVLSAYKQKIMGMITYYIVQTEREKREKILRRFVENDCLWVRDTNVEDVELLKDMVTNNILYFDPTLAVYYPQGKSYYWGIKLYFESIS